jgi:hypothetical protein
MSQLSRKRGTLDVSKPYRPPWTVAGGIAQYNKEKGPICARAEEAPSINGIILSFYNWYSGKSSCGKSRPSFNTIAEKRVLADILQVKEQI